MQIEGIERQLYLGFGANLGNRFGHLVVGIQSLQKKGLNITKLSPVYETEPLGDRDQPVFLNMVVEAETGLSPAEIVAAGLATEAELGRVRKTPGGPRTLDVDLLLDGETVVSGEGVTVPHPRLHLRRFVLVPLADLAPDLRHPTLGKTVKELLSDCPDRSRVERWRGSFLVPGEAGAV